MAKITVRYFKWRDGRPRWEPGPGHRARGISGRDLKDARGQWLSKGAAIAAAEAINAQMKEGHPPALAASARTVSALFAEVKTRAKFQDKAEGAKGSGRKLAARTRDDYLRHMEMIEAAIGDLALCELTPAAVEALHEEACAERGVAMANAILRTFKMTLYYGMKRLRWIADNPAAGVELPSLEGRTVRWTRAESETFVAAADWCGRPAVGDAHILALTTAANRADIIALPELALNEDGVYRIARAKNGRECFIPPTEQLQARLAVMRKRKAELWPNVVFANELIDTSTGAPYSAEGTRLAHEHQAVRALASGLIFMFEDVARIIHGLPVLRRNLPFTPMPSILGKRFQDLRDTAVTELFDAGCDVARIATITGHSLKTAQEILDKHYFDRHAGLAKDAGAMLDAHRRKQG